MSLKVSGHRESRIDITPGREITKNNGFSAHADCAMRLDNFVSKYFIEHLEMFSPCNLYQFFLYLVKSIYWGFQGMDWEDWLQEFKDSVSFVRQTTLYVGNPNLDTVEFAASAAFRALSEQFPMIERWNERNIDWMELESGTCYAQSFAAMKYEHRFRPSFGYGKIGDMDLAEIKNDVVCLQALIEIRENLNMLLKQQLKLEAHNIGIRELCISDGEVDQARLFHYLRCVGLSRFDARCLCEDFSELFLYTSDNLKRLISSNEQIIQRIVFSFEKEDDAPRMPSPLQSHVINFHRFTNEKDYENRSQQELDQEICSFLSRNRGLFILICTGSMKIGHAMFLKIEEGRCITFDPETQISFVTSHSMEGFLKTIELMKQILIGPNLGSNLFYKLISLETPTYFLRDIPIDSVD